MKSLKHKLMVLCSVLCLIVILVVWFFCSFLLDWTYNRTLQNEMQQKMVQASEIVEKYGILASDDTLKSKPIELLTGLLAEGMCLDISNIDIKNSDDSYKSIVFLEGIGNCELHNLKQFDTSSRTADTKDAAFMRAITVEYGSINQLSPKGSQWIWGTVLDNGYILVLSASLAHVEQAARVIKNLLVWLTVVLVPLSLVASYIFASWFTSPITRLSRAARQMADGKYDVRLPVTTKDEIGTLTEEFNSMAIEVGKSDKLQKDLIASISHDLRTPLTLMKGYAETIRDLSGDDKKARDKQLNIIIEETDRLSALVNSVLELGKLTANTQKLNLLKFDICDFCEEICYKYAAYCEQNNYVLEYENIGPRQIFADPDMLERVMHNLISNAFAHAGEDKKVILKISDVENGVNIQVIDHGQGIPPDECSKVFDRYYRSRTSEGKPGTGLGLSIVKAILQSHNFAFGVNSTIGQGSNFWFIAPICK